MKALAATLIVSSACAATGAWATGELDAVLGKALFERAWVSAPASTDASDGLGPLFSARSCSGCHAGPSLAARFTETEDGKIAGRGLVIRFGDSEGNPDRSVRVAPPLLGRALIESIDPEAVLALADPEDRNGDGVSGRARMILRDGKETIGRFGWKAGTATLDEQVADAFAREIGLSSARRPLPYGDCTALQPDCLAAPTGESALLEGHELSEEMIGMVAAFVASLDAPRRDEGPLQPAATFAALGCTVCHVPNLPDTQGNPMRAYSDLLLHDMGEELDDGVGEPGVASTEWRTAPLIAMSEGGGRRYLHDGRAATIDAAIRPHGGEAEAARDRYESASADERRALLEFIAKL